MPYTYLSKCLLRWIEEIQVVKTHPGSNEVEHLGSSINTSVIFPRKLWDHFSHRCHLAWQIGALFCKKPFQMHIPWFPMFKCLGCLFFPWILINRLGWNYPEVHTWDLWASVTCPSSHLQLPDDNVELIDLDNFNGVGVLPFYVRNVRICKKGKARESKMRVAGHLFIQQICIACLLCARHFVHC